MYPGLYRALAFVFGCVVGSFLNVVRHRLPREETVASGRSKCPDCGNVIAWYDNIPVLSFILLKGRCRQCGWRIPLIYPVIEIATGVSFLLIWSTFPSREAVAYSVLASVLIACAGIDHDLRIIPDKLTLPGLVMGLIFALTLLRRQDLDQALLRSLIGIAVGGGSLLVISLGYKLVRGVEGMGGGDVKLMAMVGAFLGPKLALLTILTASVAGGIIGLLLVRRSPERMKAAVPFGVFLSPAAIFCLLWGEVVIEAYVDRVM